MKLLSQQSITNSRAIDPTTPNNIHTNFVIYDTLQMTGGSKK